MATDGVTCLIVLNNTIDEDHMAGSLTRITPEQRDLPLVEVTTKSVACDGGGGPLGHPLTYYEIGSEGNATCGYCGKKFVLRK